MEREKPVDSKNRIFTSIMTIRLLSFPECPNAKPALQLVEDVVLDLGIAANIETLHVNSAEEAEAYRFLGSPTIQIEGNDIEQSRRSDEPCYACRVYQINDRQGGVPPRQMLVDAIHEVVRAEKDR